MLTLGSENEAYRMPNTNSSDPLPSTNSSLWTFSYDKLMLNKTDIVTNGSAVFDASLAGIELQHELFDKYMVAIKAVNSSVICDSEGAQCGSSELSCQALNETLPPFEMYINGSICSLPVLAYAKDGFNGLNTGCSLMIAPRQNASNDEHPVTLGIAFMKQYTFNLDYSNSTVTLAVNRHAINGTSIYPIPPDPVDPVDPVDPDDPVDPEQKEREEENYIIQGIVTGVVLLLVIILVIWICRRQKQKQKEALNQSLDTTREELKTKYGRRSTEQERNLVQVYSDLTDLNETANVSAIERAPPSPIGQQAEQSLDRQQTIMLGDKSPTAFRKQSNAQASPLLGGKRISTGINADDLDESIIPLDRMKTINL